MRRHKEKSQTYSNILVPDIEGDLEFLELILKSGEELARKLDEENNKSVSTLTRFVFTGDMVDKGKYDLRVLKKVLDIQENKELVAGNRDLNKMRFLQELTNRAYIENMLQLNLAPAWDSRDINRPLSFLKDLLIVKNRKPQHMNFLTKFLDMAKKIYGPEFTSFDSLAHLNGDDLVRIYQSLDFSEQRTFVAHWMLEKTMGCPLKFQNRRTELAEILGKHENDITDNMVVDSFIEEMLLNEKDHEILRKDGLVFSDKPVLPDEYFGLMYKFLNEAKQVVVLESGIVTHGALNQGNFMPQENLQQIASHDDAKRAIQTWAQKVNDRLREEFTTAYNERFQQSSFKAMEHTATEGGLSSVGLDYLGKAALPDWDRKNSSTLTSSSNLNNDTKNPESKLTKEQAKVVSLAFGNGAVLAHGHQPVVHAVPTLVETQDDDDTDQKIAHLCLDTALSDRTDVKDQQSRSGSGYGCVIRNGEVHIRGMLGPKDSKEKYTVRWNSEEQFFGKSVEIKQYLSGNEAVTPYFVTAKLSDGNYLLVRRKNAGGFASVPNKESGTLKVKPQTLSYLFDLKKLDKDFNEVINFVTNFSETTYNFENSNSAREVTQKAVDFFRCRRFNFNRHSSNKKMQAIKDLKNQLPADSSDWEPYRKAFFIEQVLLVAAQQRSSKTESYSKNTESVQTLFKRGISCDSLELMIRDKKKEADSQQQLSRSVVQPS